MRKMMFLIMVMLGFVTIAGAQGKYFSREGKIQFYSKAPMENIEAINRKATAVLDTETGKLEFSVLMRAFEFEKSLMQEHFNENYVESDKFPRAIFKGSIVNPGSVSWTKDGVYPVTVKGMMDLHGIANEMETPGTITIKSGKISANADFNITLKEYKIEIPKVVKEKISETVKVTVDVSFEELKK